MEHNITFEKAKNESHSFTSSLSLPTFALPCHLALYTSRWLWIHPDASAWASSMCRATRIQGTKGALVSEYEGRMCLRPCSLHAKRARAEACVEEHCAHDSALETVLMADAGSLQGATQGADSLACNRCSL